MSPMASGCPSPRRPCACTAATWAGRRPPAAATPCAAPRARSAPRAAPTRLASQARFGGPTG
eukprot:1183085-Prymnesium_polylepis.1